MKEAYGKIIGADTIDGARDMMNAMADVAENRERFVLLGKLAYGALRGLDSENVNTMELLMLSDIIAGWAIASIAKGNPGMDTGELMRQWILANAIRVGLVPDVDACDVAEREAEAQAEELH